MERALKILVICDVLLQDDIEAITSMLDTEVTIIGWNKTQHQNHALDESVWRVGSSWDVVFSVYSDYIFPQYALDRIRVPLNIHPALPHNPGVGYDVLPLLRDEKKCGATLHWMDEKIDHGVVLDTMPIDLPNNANYPMVRELNQKAVLDLFEKWYGLASANTLFEKLKVPRSQGRGWSGGYTSVSMRRAILIKFQRDHPLRWSQLHINSNLLEQRMKV